MSRKRKAPQRKIYPDPRFHSEVVSKFINSIMYDGKRSTAEKILYDALDKIKSKNNEDPIKIFNSDGIEVSACGNGVRCIAYLIYQEKKDKSIAIKTYSVINFKLCLLSFRS